MTPEKQWFAMRDLSRRNSNRMAHHELRDAGLEVFTPMMEMLLTIRGKKQRRNVPVIQDLLFVYETKENLDPYVAKYPLLQYRYVLGRRANEPTVIRENEMRQFIMAVSNTENPKYFMPGELTQTMYGKKVRIIGGVLDSYEGKLLSIKGMRTKRLIVEVSNLISAAVEVAPQYIQFV
ncbi:UpxY family transcription antiterminator [Bacteroides acidifaciens]|uniref:UpxY family transcription antiterminator n=1 Tax=Bacteroides acidifaciens TaxID=85831 RepID=UPI00336BC35D